MSNMQTNFPPNHFDFQINEFEHTLFIFDLNLRPLFLIEKIDVSFEIKRDDWGIINELVVIFSNGMRLVATKEDIQLHSSEQAEIIGNAPLGFYASLRFLITQIDVFVRRNEVSFDEGKETEIIQLCQSLIVMKQNAGLLVADDLITLVEMGI